MRKSKDFPTLFFCSDIHVVPKKSRNSVRNLMCVGRYAENVVWLSFYLTYWIIKFLENGFSPKASGFCPFGDATGLEESGARTVVWLIQAGT